MVFGKLDTDAVQRETDKANWVNRSSKMYKIRAGDHRIRIMPPREGTVDAYHKTAIHYGFKIGGEFKRYPCPKKYGRNYCPICEEVHNLYEIGETKKARRIKASQRFYYNIYDEAAIVDGIKILNAPKTLHEAIRTIINSWGDITDPVSGYTLTITATSVTTETGTFLQYTILPDKHESAMAPEILALADTMPVLDQIAIEDAGGTMPTDEELLAALPFVDMSQAGRSFAKRGTQVPPGQQTAVEQEQTTGPKVPKCLAHGSFDNTDAECRVCTVHQQCLAIQEELALKTQASVPQVPVVAQIPVVPPVVVSQVPVAPINPSMPIAPPVSSAETTSASALDDLEATLRG